MNRLSTAKHVQVVTVLGRRNNVNSIVRMTGAAKHYDPRTDRGLRLLAPHTTIGMCAAFAFASPMR